MTPDANLPEVLDDELVTDDAPGAALTLFQTSDPRVALERMAAHAKLLVDVVKARRLSQRIGGKEHLLAEAWACLGSMLGVHAVVVWTRPNESGDGFLARVEARTLDGRIVGAAEAECSRAEPTWSKRAPYALRSMAQTRATSRALRAPLGALVTLAGYEPTGVEEMPAQETPRTAPSAVLEPAMTPQKQRIGELIRELERLEPGRDWKAHCREFVGVPPERMSVEIAAHLIRELTDRVEELGGE